MKKPDGLTILSADQLPDALYALKLRDLCGIGANMERRLMGKGIRTVKSFMALAPKQARAIWGSVEGERFWYGLHGYDLPERETQKRVVGHSRVLDPALRRQDKAQGIAQALTIKAAARLRRYELHAARVYLGVRTAEGMRWGAEQRLTSPAQDNFTILAALRTLWTAMAYDTHGAALKKLSISLYDLYKTGEITPDLFASALSTAPKPLAPRHRLELSTVMDRLNRTYGAGTIHLGMLPKTSAGHVGTKIAFTRIPDKQEFRE